MAQQQAALPDKMKSEVASRCRVYIEPGTFTLFNPAITVGSAGRDPKPFDVSGLAMGNHSLTGVFLGAEIANERARAMIGRHVEDVAAGRLKVVVDRTYPLAEAAAAHAYLESRQAVGRVVLLP